MQFDAEDEDAFHRRRDELGEQFAQWLNAQDVPGDPNDAGLLMDWRWGYADGTLDRWTVADVREFLFGWCPRKLSAESQHCREIPVSVAAFVEFLAHNAMLAPGSDPPARIRSYAEGNVGAFVREMGDPANFGMAKSLFGGGGGPVTGAGNGRDQVEVILRQLDRLSPEGLGAALQHTIDDDGPPPVVGPVRLPSEEDQLASIRATTIMHQLRLLADYCAPPGRSLTGKGNLRLVDARHLVDALGTDGDLSQARNLRSTEDFPGLSRLVEIALTAGLVRRQRGRLITVGRFAALGEAEAYEKVVRAAVSTSCRDPYGRGQFDDEHIGELLVELLDSDPDGVEVATLVTGVGEIAAVNTFGLGRFLTELITGQVEQQLDVLVYLGVVSITGAERCVDCDLPHGLTGRAALTAAGVPVAVELAREAGAEVVLRLDPVTANPTAITDMIGMIDEKEWLHDASAWLAAQPDPIAAGHALVGEITAAGRDTPVALAGLEAVGSVLGDGAVEAVRAQLGGPHDGVVLYWLVARSAVDPAAVDPVRYVTGLMDVLAAVLDAGGPADLVAILDAGDPGEHLAVLDEIWRIDHPRLPDVLETIGAHHPVKSVAKAARKALVRHRSRLASLRATTSS